MNSSNESFESIPEVESGVAALDSSLDESENSMDEFYLLQQELAIATVALTGIIFVSVWVTYSLNIALNYLIGACTGMVYLRMLAKNVEQLGRSRKRIGNNRLALLIGLIVIATQWNQLHILPVFLGFLTYKAALIVYVLRITLLPDSSVRS